MAWLKNGLNTSDVITNADVDNWDDGIYDLHQGNSLYVATTGVANTYVATFTTPYTVYTTGLTLRVKFNLENTGTSTINVDGLGVKTIKKVTGAGIEVLEAGDIIADGVYILVYNGTDMIIAGQMRVKPMIQVFTSSGTFTAPQTGKYKVTVVGGGGSGAYASGNPASGGGGGGTAIEVVTLTKSSNTTVTIGAGGASQTVNGTAGNTGGTSSFGAFCSATGGAGGGINAGASISNGGAGGSGSGGDINTTGHYGGDYVIIAGSLTNRQGGSSALFGQGSYGSGSAGSTGASAVGQSGIVIVEWMEG